VVDDLEEARKLCYGSDRHKVVSVDGTMFKPNGTFTGLFQGRPAIGPHTVSVCTCSCARM
jgi:chromosome segregation ATPase